MAYITVIECDFCGSRIPPDVNGTLMIRAGVVRISLDICETCAKKAADRVREQQSPTIIEVQDERTTRVLSIANKGIIAYGEGAGPDLMVGYLRDIVSNARRNA